jgi:phosphopantothenoylcysteine decarboxylase/phosphopantothenate--cysteine ligase
MARICLGVSGGIGAYKAVEIARLLQQRGHDVRAVMTRTARRFVGPLTFEAITRHPVITSQFAPGMNADIEHIALASDIDLLLVAPATANILGKFANGIADDFLSALYLATRAPVLAAPAMNTNMWNHPAVRANMDALGERSVRFVDPGSGYLACGWIGKGRLAEPEEVAEAADRLLKPDTSLTGRRVLVTAGPTLEDLDPVRFLGNRSSGRMGFAVADVARDRGAKVTVVAGPTTLTPPTGVDVIRVRSAREMHDAVMAHLDEADVVIMAAAVADFTPAEGAAARKIEKGSQIDGVTLHLVPTPDILADAGAHRGDRSRPVLVGFAAQTGDPVDAARRKLAAKRADLIVANDVSEPGAGFDVDTNHVTLVFADRVEPLPMLSKHDVAGVILDRVAATLAAPSPALR